MASSHAVNPIEIAAPIAAPRHDKLRNVLRTQSITDLDECQLLTSLYAEPVRRSGYGITQRRCRRALPRLRAPHSLLE